MSKNKLSFAFIDKIRQRNSNVSPEQIEAEVGREIKKYRENKLKKIVSVYVSFQ